jgi:hypothetical protein
MNIRTPSASAIEVGDEIRFQGQTYTVAALTGDGVGLIDASGTASAVALAGVAGRYDANGGGRDGETAVA